MKKSILIPAIFLTLAFTSCNLNKTNIISAEDLASKKIGVQKGTTGEKFVTDKVTNAEITSYKTLIDAVQDLKNSTIQAIVIDECPALQITATNSDLMIIRDKIFEENKEEYAIAVKKGNTELLNSINETIKEIKSNGKLDELTKNFMSPNGIITIPEIVQVPANKTLKLGTNAQFSPFEYISGKDVVGFDISLGEYIAQKEGARLQIVDMNFSTLIQAVNSGSVDFIAAAMSVTPERQKEVDFSIPYFSSEQVIIIKK